MNNKTNIHGAQVLNLLKKAGMPMTYNAVNNWLRQLVYRNLLLYKVWFYTYRRIKGDPARLPSDNDDFYFDGYPRSGNTFFAQFLLRVYPDNKFAHHLHSIAALKIALGKNIPSFIIVREPEDAVVSNLFRVVAAYKKSPDRDLIEHLLLMYYDYYRFVNDNRDRVQVLSFRLCIDNEVQTVKKIAQGVGLEIKCDSYLEKMLEGFKIYMEKKEKEKDAFASSLPNEDRKEFKKRYVNEIVHSPSYQKSRAIYNKLIRYDLMSEKP